MLSGEPVLPTCWDEGSTPDACGDEADDELASAFPGCSFTHVLSVVSNDRLRTTITILSHLDALGVRLTKLCIIRVEESFEHRIRVHGLRPNQARDLSRRLSLLPSVHRASVEHQITRAT